MNVLFVGGGRRVVLAKLFIDRGWMVYAYEASTKVPIAHVAKDIIAGKRWADPAIYDHIANVACEYSIDLVLPLMDAAIPICARLHTTAKALATQDNAICTDKRAFEQAVLASPVASVYPVPQEDWSVIAKPICGFGSHGIIRDVNPLLNLEGYILQKQLEGKEYTVDAYFSPDGEYIDSVPRLRRIVADGEVKSSVTCERPDMQHYTRVIGEYIGLSGPINMQFICDRHGVPFVTECNARFGGGWPLSIAAGLDAIRLIERDYFGHNRFHYISNSWTRGLATERYFEEYIYKEDSS